MYQLRECQFHVQQRSANHTSREERLVEFIVVAGVESGGA